MKTGDYSALALSLITAALDSQDLLLEKSIRVGEFAKASGPEGPAAVVLILAGVAAEFVKLFAEGINQDPDEFLRQWALRSAMQWLT